MLKNFHNKTKIFLTNKVILLVKKIIKDHSNTEFSQLCYYQMKWRKNKDFQTLAKNRRNIDSLGKLQD